jgi:hypothetical protein
MKGQRQREKRARPGRPKGAINRMTQKAREAAAKSGMLPHEILLAIARGQSVPGVKNPTRAEIIDAAKAAAPFYAPRLVAVAAKVNTPGNP